MDPIFFSFAPYPARFSPPLALSPLKLALTFQEHHHDMPTEAGNMYCCPDAANSQAGPRASPRSSLSHGTHPGRRSSPLINTVTSIWLMCVAYASCHCDPDGGSWDMHIQGGVSRLTTTTTSLVCAARMIVLLQRRNAGKELLLVCEARQWGSEENGSGDSDADSEAASPPWRC